MAIKLNWQDLQKRIRNGVEAQKVMLNWVQIRPAVIPPTPTNERIIVRMQADSQGNLYIPTSQFYNHYPSDANPYDRKVYIDDGNYVNYSWTSTYGWELLIGTWYNPNSSHIVKIEPMTEAYKRAKAFIFAHCDNIPSLLLEIIEDETYMWYAQSDTYTGENFRAGQYRWCSNIHSIPNEVIPSTVTTIWNGFRNFQYTDCYWVSALVPEVLPNSVTWIWDYFRNSQYSTTHVSVATPEVMPNTVTEIGISFRAYQYSTTWITTAPTEVMSSAITSIPSAFRMWQFSWCSFLVTPSPEVLPNVTSIAGSFRVWQYSTTNITSTPAEVIPSTVTSIDTNWFRARSFMTCASLTTASPEVFPSSITTINGRRFRLEQFLGCALLSSASIIARANVNWNYRQSQFSGIWPNLDVTISWNEVDASNGAWIDANGTIRVPSALLADYQSSWWSYINNIIGY